MSDRLRAACLNLFRAANGFRLNLDNAALGDQHARLIAESAWVRLLDVADECRRLTRIMSPSPAADWLRATLADIDYFRDYYVAPHGIARCIAGIPVDPAARTVVALRFPTLTIDPPPDVPIADPPAGTKPSEGATPADGPGRRRAVSRDERNTPRKAKGRNIEALMLKTLADNPDALHWSIRQWAAALECAVSTIAATQTWQTRLRAAKALEAAERVRHMDTSRTHFRGRARRKPQNG